MNNISVCIATYNGEQYIEQQLDSIIKQLRENDEIIISDDSSTDNTLNIIKSYDDKRIKIYTDNCFHNHVRNFEFAVSKATNDIIFLSDQDDIWVSDKIKTILPYFKDYDLITTDMSIIDDNNNIILSSYFKKYPFRAKPGIFRNLWRHSFAGCCMAFNKKILVKAFPIPKDITNHDTWIGFVANTFYKVKFIEKPLTLYRRHNNNLSSGSSLISNNTFYQKILFRWNIIKYLPKVFFR